MSRNNQTPAAAKAETIQPAASPKIEPVYTIERLRRDCLTLFGVTQSTFDGAVHGLEGVYTVEQMKSRIEAWRGEIAVPAGKGR